MGSNPRELSLDFKPAYVPKTVSSFLRELSMIGDGSERLSKLDQYVKQLEDEMRKIDVFKRELPLCMILIEEAIMALKEGEMKCSPSGVRPVMEEFIPLKKKSDEDEDGVVVKIEKDNRDKKTWMSSVQLWSCDGYSRSDVTYDGKHKSTDGMEERTSECDRYETEKPFRPNNGGAFMPFKGFSGITAMARKEAKEIVPMNGLSLLTPGAGGDKTPKREMGSDCSISKGNGSTRTVPSSTSNNRSNIQSTQQQTSRKQRRCWSPELHRRFITALQQLGGSLVATPKQIRELMQVDGLTNDEVKSHLQKYRLHTRRISASTSPAASSPANQPVVVLGELWAAQDQYGDSSKTSSALSGSPQGPLQLVGSAGGISAAGDSMEDEDEKSESYSWKGHLQKPSEDNV